MLLLLSIQVIGLEDIVEAIEDDIMVESWVTSLVRMCGIPLCLRVDNVVTILYQIDGLTIGHTVQVNQVGCGMVDDVIMVHQAGNLRTEDLSAVPVRRVCARVSATEDSLTSTRHLPTLLNGIEDV